jgi:hypothetical protein
MDEGKGKWQEANTPKSTKAGVASETLLRQSYSGSQPFSHPGTGRLDKRQPSQDELQNYLDPIKSNSWSVCN